MSTDATNVLWELALPTPGHKFVLSFLADKVNQKRADNKTWWGYAGIARHTGYSYSHVRHIMYDLRRLGVVEKVQGHSQHEPPTYLLHLDRLPSLPPRVSAHGQSEPTRVSAHGQSDPPPECPPAASQSVRPRPPECLPTDTEPEGTRKEPEEELSDGSSPVTVPVPVTRKRRRRKRDATQRGDGPSPDQELEKTPPLDHQKRDGALEKRGSKIKIKKKRRREPPEHQEELQATGTVLGILTRLSEGFDPGHYDLQERIVYWSGRIPDSWPSTILDGLFMRVALDGRRWSQVELRLEDAEREGWPADKAWSRRVRRRQSRELVLAGEERR